ncbi:hypothetical protein [Companilactobacillus metriopterae]|uniref:hypothetical protein n=1 Tax=Companilactobacillus metriopterae TaxID=1909267 RepID=UPI00100C094B|nr:hypothetical protein [Companilactobacillus metriopterae]
MKKRMLLLIATIIVAFLSSINVASAETVSQHYAEVYTDYSVMVTPNGGQDCYTIDDATNDMIIPNKPLHLDEHTPWFTDRALVNLTDGKVYYEVSTNVFVPEQSVTRFYVMSK